MKGVLPVMDNYDLMELAKSPESLRGIVKYITYYNEKTNFAVFKLRYYDEIFDDGNYSNIVCTGRLPDIRKGMLVKLYGAYTNNQYGTQYAFKKYEYAEPKFSEEIISYLSSGLIKEVDLITAKKIYKAFGNDTISILDNDPDQLLTIKGIASKKAKAIIDSWRIHRDNLDMHLLLQRYGLSTDTISKLKDAATLRRISVKALITNYAYEMVYKYDTIAFDTMDMLLMNIVPDRYEEYKVSYKRIECAAYSYIQHHTIESGDLCIPYEGLLASLTSKTSLSLDVLDDIFKKNIDKMYHLSWNTSLKSSINYSASGYVYIASDGAREFYIAAHLLQTLKDQYNKNIEEFRINERRTNTLIDTIQKELNIEYNEDQKKAITTVLNNNITVITGGPGTGKTTIIRGILSILEDYERLEVLLLAPTGKAAKRMAEATNHKAKTIHLALYTDADNLSSYDCVIVDESSMIDNTLMAMLLSKLSTMQRIVFVGDINQLPSVGPGNVLTNIIDSEIFEVVTLNKIYRQEHGYIIYNAHEINDGRFPSLYNDDSSDFYYIDSQNTNYGKIEILEHLLRQILPKIVNSDGSNGEWYKELQILSPMKKGDSGVININNFMQSYYWDINEQHHKKQAETWHIHDITSKSRYTTNKIIEENRYPLFIKKGDYTYCVGDRVINNKNNYDKLVFNGETGYITKISLRQEIIDKITENKKFRSDGKFYDSDYTVTIDFSNGDDHIVEFSYEELDNISLAYCITIHKSQGSEYKYLIVYLNREHYIMQQRNLLYTAITRAKNMVILISDVESIARAVNNNQAIQRVTLLKEQLQYYYDHYEEITDDKMCSTLEQITKGLPTILRMATNDIQAVMPDDDKE